MRGPVVAWIVLAVAGLGGCAGTSSVSDALTGGTLDKRRSAVAVLKAQILGHRCAGGSLTIGKKLSGDTYSAVATVQTSASGSDIMQVELAPDEYHVINVTCSAQSGRTHTTVALGQKQGSTVFGFGGAYKRSFATFHVKSGEIVNIGALTVLSGTVGGAHLSVSDLPAASVERFKRERPNLAQQMTTRLMAIVRPAMPSAERLKMCTQLRELAATLPSFASHVPQDCPPPAATASAPTE